MQIRLSVLAARDGAAPSRAHALGPQGRPPRSSAQIADVLVTAPVGTSLGAVAGALAGAVAGRPGARGTRSSTHVHLYAGDQRLDERAVLGHPPLVDGAVLRLDEPDPDHVPAGPAPGAPTELRVVGGPDAGGIHLLMPGRVRVGRSAQADVPLDDPDVSRFHLALEVDADGRVSVVDLGSTNGTALDGLPVGAEPVPVPPGSVLGLGESALVVAPGGGRPGPLGSSDLIADGQGRLQLTR
ncbi:FHA domain-containing protein, partial [Streptacidiphilus carbonis]|uniref:FHA domain-containing protein n=1 Tax=Streptacidiphilus carbonis TaxID=105422 RepID=UPI0005A8598E